MHTLDPTPRPRPARRSLFAFALFALGLLLARELSPLASTLWFAGACALLVLAVLIPKRAAMIPFAGAMIALGGGLYTARILEPDPSLLTSHTLWRESKEPTLVTLRALIRSDPRNWSASGRTRDLWNFDASLQSITAANGELAATGLVSVWLSSEHHPPIRAGESVTLTGFLETPTPPTNPGAPDPRRQAAQDGRIGRLRVASPELIHPAHADQTLASRVESAALRALAAVRRGAHGALTAALGADESREQHTLLLSALLLGDYDPASSEITGAFTRLGLIHILSISGFNLVVLAGVGLFLIRLFGDMGRWETPLIILIVLVYLAAIPVAAPVLRSVVMLLVFLLAQSLGRRYDRLTILGWTALAAVIWKPLDLWSPGFQLSFGIVAALLAFGDTARDRLFGAPLKGIVAPTRESLRAAFLRLVPPRLKSAIAASLLCWAVATPIVMVHTGLFSPLAPITTLIVVPISVVLMWVGYTTLLVGAVIPPLAPYAGEVLALLARTLLRVVMNLDVLPGASISTPAVSPLWAAACLAVVVLWLLRPHRWRLLPWAGGVVIGAWLILGTLHTAALPPGTLARIDTLDAGRGSCTLVRFAPNHAALWDCGSLSPGTLRREIPRALRELGAWKVRTVILSTPADDHCNGVRAMLRPLGVRTVIVAEPFLLYARAVPNSPAALLLDEIRERRLTLRVVHAGEILDFGPCRLRFTGPAPDATTMRAAALTAELVLDGDRTLSIPPLLEGRPSARLEIPASGAPSVHALVPPP